MNEVSGCVCLLQEEQGGIDDLFNLPEVDETCGQNLTKKGNTHIPFISIALLKIKYFNVKNVL